MKTLSLYYPRDTFVHRQVDPFTKLIYLICSMIAAFAVPTLFGAAMLFLIQVIVLAMGRELGRAFKTILGSLVLLLTVLIIQGLFHPGNHTLVWSLGPIHFYKEGLLFAITLSIRVVNIIAASCVLVLTTSPSAVMEACVRRGLSPKAGYVITAILQMIPVMLDSAATIREAQQSRGMSLQGGVWKRMRAFLPLFGPIVLSSFMSIQDKAMALEVRGFSVKGKRSLLNEETMHRSMYVLRILLVLVTVCVVVWGIVY